MNKFILIILTFISHFIIAQQQQNRVLFFDGLQREFIIYIPNSYSPSIQTPILFNFHGGGGTSSGFLNGENDMRPIADTANFIAVYPQAAVDPIDGSNAWLHKTPTTHNDVNFIEAIIDTLSSEFNINNDRIYACGYSEGGIFSYELGCRLNNRIAAFASVSGSMLTESYRLTNGFGSCSPNHPTAVLLIPGTNDGSFHSMYNGFQPYYLSVNEITTYWSTHNNTDPSPTVNMLPNLNTMDGSTVESRIWENGNNCVSVKELKVINGDHDWPGSFGNMDINASQEIWKFVSKFDVNGLIDCGAVETSLLEFKPIKVYPNPTTSIINIENHTSEHQLIKIFNIHGAELHSEVLTDINNSISLKQYDQQILFIKIMNKVYRIILI